MDAKFYLQPNHGCYGDRLGKSYNVLKMTNIFIKKERSVQNSDCNIPLRID